MTTSEPAVRLRAYGGLRMWRDGVEVDIGPPRQRVLLAALLAARGGVVGITELVELIWGAEPSQSAVNQLHRLVGQVRRLFEPDLPSRATGRWVHPAGEGYRLVADALDTDLAATPSLDAVQEPAFAGLDPEVLEHPLFVTIAQERIQIAVDAADQPSALSGVQRIAASAPLHEPLQARLIRLLVLSGRRAEALVLFDEVRHRLADELGTDPGAELRAAHLLALEDEQPAAHRPVQLPRRVAGFVPRHDLTSALDAQANNAAIVILSGMGGVGKTAVAVDWAHRLAPRFPDGQLYLNLRGFDPSGRLVDPVDALNTLLESVGVSLASLGGTGLDARAARFRSALADRKMIVLLDNARDSEQVRPLLPGVPGCLVVVTSRNRLTGLVAREGARPVHVNRLGDAAASELLAKRVGSARLAAEPAASQDLVRFCAGLPLALAIAAAHASVRPDMRLSEFVEELELDALSTGESGDDVRSAFSWSYEALSPAAARLFRLLAVHPGPEISIAAAASIAGAGPKARSLLAELSAANMLTEADGRRYTMHDLLHAYADELLESSGERLDAEKRLVEHYVRSIRHSYLMFGRPQVTYLGPPSAGMTIERPADFAAALEWYLREKLTLRAVIDLALLRRWHREAIEMVLDLRAARGAVVEPPADSAEQSERALKAAQSLGEPVLEAGMLRESSIGLHSTDPNQFRSRLERALELYESIDDLAGQAMVWRNMAWSTTAEPSERLMYAKRAVDTAELCGEPSVLVFALAALGSELRDQGDLASAADAALEAHELAVQADVLDMSAQTAVKLAEIKLALADHSAAVRYASTALDLTPPAEVFTPFQASAILAEATLALGDTARASAVVSTFRQAAAQHSHIYRVVWGDDEVDAVISRVDACASSMH
ncbi:DNA-binding SARP family transcriptional activator/tetratricopeptide (TPR) repeat protein [Actinoplanes lutulentus]|uniref:DNA-binding SARP family transcriptional activator n=1 Tax=Actinoplanes lutulentus TaxID=1287878 RepID=A0A327ZJW1_9ACTN|nr:BTAD domain-containing putative transcriptional regulator [Actinoplanes lutulentus]MBB2941457.1 DNA-binding SARP family transcriptional activator/tetratricopeptide (TPR) repeat protein [Actinoplanes lutulentus]RAK36948.1 DNA-binding SARP family transcriptional activator [Actinoplanes lutulentus]